MLSVFLAFSLWTLFFFLLNSLECESSLIVVFPACLSVRVTRTSSYQAMTAHPHFAVLTHMLIDPQLVV